MARSLCSRCRSVKVTHKKSNWRPLCEKCDEIEMWGRILFDITEGRLQVPVDEDGNVVLVDENGINIFTGEPS